ncbi:thiamine diphosphate-binding protein [Phycomyces nitens]|nr:thiamine diphosphate-binding protein [Phycomyces nitens]
MPSQLLNGDDAAALVALTVSENVQTSKPLVATSYTLSGTSPKVTLDVSVDANRAVSAALLSSAELLQAIPHLYQLAATQTGQVIHVSAGESTKKSFGDYSHIMAVRQAGLGLLSSSTVQEAYDLAIIAHAVAIQTSTPFIHFYDSQRVSSEYSTVQTVAPEILQQLITSEQIEAYKQKALPAPQTAYLRYKASQEQSGDSVDVATAVKDVMAQFGTLTRRHYSPVEYTGHPDAELVVVAMGAGAAVVEQTIGYLQSITPQKIGVLNIRLYRPLSDADLLTHLPESVRRLAVLEPVQDHTATWNPLFLDITAAFQSSGRDDVEILSGQYGVNSLDFSPAMVNAVLRQLAQPTIERRFVVDEIVKAEDALDINVEAEQFIIVGDAALAKKYVQAQPESSVQLYTIENDDTTHSHIRISSRPGSLLPSLIQQAKAVVVVDASVYSVDSINRLAPHGLVAFGGVSAIHLEVTLPDAVKRAVATKGAKVVLVDSKALAHSNFDEILQTAELVEVPASWATLGVSAAPVYFKAPESKLPVETPYIRLLDQVFQDRLEIANAVHSESIWAASNTQPSAATPEFGYGKLVSKIQQQTRLIDAVETILKDNTLPTETFKALSNWLLLVKSPSTKPSQLTDAANAAVSALSANPISSISVEDQAAFFPKSNWLIGSDNWSADLGASGVHHVISSGENINMLIVDTTSYSTEAEREQHKKDIGLYAMSFGSVYVASVAVYSSYTGVLHALIEADAYKGPSVVLAYLPIDNQVLDPVKTLKETKVAVDSGAWPLYRWNPVLEAQNKEAFTLDSQRIKKDLEKFLERENHFSQIVLSQPALSKTLVSSLESDVKKRQQDLKRKAREDYAKLLSGLGGVEGPPLTVLFGSDNGNAEGLAKKIATRAKARNLKVKFMAMDDYEDVQELANETNLLIVCSTAGQGELPSNGREFWKALNALLVGEVQLSDLNFAVFGLGDRNYWPRAEDASFYNRPGKIIEAKLEALGANRLLALGLGDDQDADGYETGFQAWQPEFWKALGVKDVGGDEEPPKITDDQMKINSNYLRGTIREDLLDTSRGDISETNGKLLKFHGSYGQDDRDLREERKKMGLEKAYSFMIRVRMPGGVSTPAQWLVMDKLADSHANGAIKMTTRQAFQLHGILKANLRETIRGINHSLLSTLAACGDVNRNIMVTPVTEIPEVHAQVQKFSEEVMLHLAPRTNAYHEIWLADELVAGHAVQDHEPIYGATYLPRKFKIVIAVPPNNDVDIYAHDLGYIAIIKDKKVIGYNVMIGGGMGATHGNKKTYPRPSSMLGYVPADVAVKVGEAVMTTQRDYGDRTNRKHARLKYTVDTYGLDFFKSEIEKRSGATFAEPAEYEFKDNADRYGWTKGVDDKWHFCMFVENGKIKDTPEFQVRTGLRELAEWHTGEFRLSPNQHLVIANVPEADLEKTKAHLAKFKMDNLAFSGLRLNAMACVALPTCGLAMAESERYLPTLVGLLEQTMEEAGLKDDAITIRMTGCPNGCARPYLAELAFVGKAPGAYNVYLGGGHKGERLNKLYKESLREAEILAEIKPIIKRYALERNTGEPFGDWVIRAGYVKKTITGLDFHD